MPSPEKSNGCLPLLVITIGLIAVLAIPLAAGVMLTWLIPEIGEPHHGVTSWSILHFLWIVPVMFVIGIVLERIGKRLAPSSRVLREVFEDGILAVILAAAYSVFFDSFWGCLVAAIISLVLYVVCKPFIAWMERRADGEQS